MRPTLRSLALPIAALAATKLTQGINPDAKKLAQAVIDSQSAEIAEMSS